MMQLPSDLHLNTSFSTSLPGMQTAIDSTSLGTFKECPRKYYYSIIWGWVPKEDSVHLAFGLMMHEAREEYDKFRCAARDHDEALEHVVWNALAKTWNKELGRPWLSGDPAKNRQSLIRSIIWYLDQLGKDDPIKCELDEHGKPFVEISFRFDSGFKTLSHGEPIALCGHGDKIGSLAGDPFWLDMKTTKHGLEPRYFAQFSPNNQMSLYDVAGKVILQKPTRGVIIDALQVGATFTRAKRHLVPRTEALREEWLRGFGWWARQMESCAVAQDWPMNDTACDKYFGCQFRTICNSNPENRQAWLERDFKRRTWNPLQRRGDI